MKYALLSESDRKVSKICLGTMTFGEQNTQKEAHQQLDLAVDYGVNFIDTAEMYSSPARAETQGDSERIIGRWLKGKALRDRLMVATKITGPLEYFKYIRDPLNFSPSQIRTALEQSLDRLQTDYIDIYQLHWPERKTNFFGARGYEHIPDDSWTDNFGEILFTMDQLIKEGKIRQFGVSNETPWGLMHFIRLAEREGLPKPVTIQNPYSLLNRTYEIGLAEISMREQVGLLAYSPLAYGWLTGKYHDGSDVQNSRITRFPKLARYNHPLASAAAGRYAQLALDHGLRPAQMALAYLLAKPFVGSVIIGATTTRQLKENIMSTELSLDDKIIEEIDAIHKAVPNPAP